MKYSFKFIAVIFCIALNAFFACTKKPVIEDTSTVNMSGEWFIVYYQNGAAVTGFKKISSYNTSDPNSSKVWVDDPAVWPFKAKLDVDYSSLSFKSLPAADNTYEAGEKVKVYEGKIVLGGGHSRSGHPVDSIYLKLEFTDDPGNVYEIRGHMRTGFFEDEY